VSNPAGGNSGNYQVTMQICTVTKIFSEGERKRYCLV